MGPRKPSKEISGAKARQLWNQYGFKHPRELDCDVLAFALGLLVIEDKLDTADARLVTDGTKGIIRVNQGIIEPGRKRFAVAHEVGHWLLHRSISQLLACTSDDMADKYKGSVEEIEANIFAAELLMPSALISSVLAKNTLNKKLIETLALECLTSFTATALRCVDLSEDCCAVVFSENGRIRWWRGSCSFEEHFWIVAGQPIPNGTASSKAKLATKSNLVIKEEVARELWVEPRTDYGKDDNEDGDDCENEMPDYFIEEAFADTKYGRVVSILFMP